MSRFRIDFSIRELDIPEDQARGIRFGDDVEVSGIMDFFDRCRDAARTLFLPSPNKAFFSNKDNVEGLMKELDELKRADVQRQNVEKMKKLMIGMAKTAPNMPPPHAQKNWDYDELKRGDDGSRGGDGPSSKEWLKKVAESLNRDRGRY